MVSSQISVSLNYGVPLKGDIGYRGWVGLYRVLSLGGPPDLGKLPHISEVGRDL